MPSDRRGEITPEEFLALLRRIGFRRIIIELALNLFFLLLLVVVTIRMPRGIPQIMAVVAVGFIMVVWVLGLPGRLRRK